MGKAFSPFPIMFSALPKTKSSFSVTFILTSASAFNLDQSKNLLFGRVKELQDSISRCTDQLDRAEILLKMALNTIQSINQHFC